MITVEGMDNTGKTTLVERIQQDFPQLKFHPSIGNKHDIKQIRQQACECVRGDVKNPLTLWDRSRIISEYIYNPILKSRPIAFPPSEYWELLSDFTRRPQLVIYCTRQFDKIMEGFDEREQLGGVFEHASEIYMAYDSFMSYLSFFFARCLPDNVKSEVVVYNFEASDYIEFLYPIIEKYIERVSK